MTTDQQEQDKIKADEFEAQQNLNGFFDLLLKIDRRINPQLYANKRNPNNTNQGK